MENNENTNQEITKEDVETYNKNVDNYMAGEDKKQDDTLAFTPVLLNEDEEKLQEKKDQLVIDNKLQYKVANNKDVYESELEQLKNYGLEWELKGGDPVGINEVIFNPNVMYKIGNRIISPAGTQLITNDIMECALSIDSAAIRNEEKIKLAGGGTMEVTEHGGIILVTSKT